MRIALVVSLLVLAALAPAAQAAQDPVRIIVARDPGLTAAERADIRADAGVDLVRTLRIANTEVVSTTDPKAALAELRRDPDVRYAEIDQLRRAFSNDPDYHFQWALTNTGTNISDVYDVPDGVADADMDVPETWAQSTGSGITVAVVDTGIMATHPDLAGKISPLSRNFVADGKGYADGDGHGTHVSGIIAARRDNGAGIAGIAPDAGLLALRVLDDTGRGYDSDIAEAFDYAGDHGVRVVNASLGGTGGTGDTLAAAIARHPNTLYVVAAGNGGGDGVGDDNETTPVWPCNIALDNVICVGASTDSDDRAGFSNYGANAVDLFAPGHLIWSTVLTGGTDYESGTSMASPAVAAEAALALAAAPGLSTAALKAAVLGTAEPKPSFDGKSVTGGRANAAAAVASVAPATPPDDDGDGVPNAADSTRRGPDTDGDGVPALDDKCPTVSGHGSPSGCPVQAPPSTPSKPAPPSAPVVTPAPTGTVLADRDGDGRSDSLDACPAERAATADGCPVPRLRALKVSKRKHHKVKVRVLTDRVATVTFKLERRVCNAKGRRCRWRKTATDAVVTAGGVASFSSRTLRKGRYRVAVRVSSSAGRAKLARKSFRI